MRRLNIYLVTADTVFMHNRQHLFGILLRYLDKGKFIKNINQTDGTAGNISFPGNRPHQFGNRNLLAAPNIQEEPHHAGTAAGIRQTLIRQIADSILFFRYLKGSVPFLHQL